MQVPRGSSQPGYDREAMKFLLFSLLTSIACTDKAEQNLNDTGECGFSHGRLWGQVYGMEGENPYGSAIVKVTPEGGEPIDVSADLQGLYEVELSPGDYEVGAADDIGGCFTENDLSVSVEACGSHEINPVMSECFGR